MQRKTTRPKEALEARGQGAPTCVKQFVPLKLLNATMTRDRPRALDNLSGLAIETRPGGGSWKPTRLNRKGQRKGTGPDLYE